MTTRAATLVTVLAWILAGLGDAVAAAEPELPVKGPADLAPSFTSPFDGSQQPYRLYLPSPYNGSRAMPLLVALHGTGGDHNKYFDHETYHHGIYKREAEKRGIIVLCPLGNDAEGRPTEWRGVGELHVLAALEDAKRRFQIDPDRIVCSGQSMGGTGATYLCCRYPDVFAAGIPLASTYGHVSLITNLRDVPMLYVHGAKDWPIYAKTGPIPITTEMQRLGYNGSLWMIPEAGHNTMDVSTERVMDWALKQWRVAHPSHTTHRAYFPPHGRAWWVEIQEIERPGWFAEAQQAVLAWEERNAREQDRQQSGSWWSQAGTFPHVPRALAEVACLFDQAHDGRAARPGHEGEKHHPAGAFRDAMSIWWADLLVAIKHHVGQSTKP